MQNRTWLMHVCEYQIYSSRTNLLFPSWKCAFVTYRAPETRSHNGYSEILPGSAKLFKFVTCCQKMSVRGENYWRCRDEIERPWSKRGENIGNPFSNGHVCVTVSGQVHTIVLRNRGEFVIYVPILSRLLLTRVDQFVQRTYCLSPID